MHAKELASGGTHQRAAPGLFPFHCSQACGLVICPLFIPRRISFSMSIATKELFDYLPRALAPYEATRGQARKQLMLVKVPRASKPRWVLSRARVSGGLS